MTILNFVQPRSVVRALDRLDTPARYFGAYILALAALAALMTAFGALGGLALNLGVTAVFLLLSAELLLTVAFLAIALGGPFYWTVRHRATRR
ncbi:MULTISPECIES: hypothetical protein [Arthrobacter]|uniref:Uncharacterized protein n=2 Tax=Arthrobacter TaxID=1663 RepID=A0ABU9KIA3_9MICC|nr:hypothetical protein [Arthrobacter sp. YJM1]MDP5226688.1 hypothetical protein [Arthrobacter sp. YJM1]